ncbi:two component transcriptional regulator, LuxR family [Verrucomicrobium sp. GAS474]|uniref:response regulator transcription factor n=1 Tax=Verrucomicrobium sp. GAS474 TaxID=1882831 RepID=UPI00087C10FF|nr:response regulator transcription factor [Verrucomicrobium sp. GAS474]SDT93821.1 two component transcriptional regulator, LuxR family [Verrucomicrobium sp. GAS474]
MSEASPSSPCRVLIVDDHPVVRLGVTLSLEAAAEEFVLCGEAATPGEALDLVERLRPDAAVVDLHLGGRDGFDLIDDLTALHPPLRIVVYTAMEERLYVRRALRAGARGYLMKGCDPALLVPALRTVVSGGLAVSEAAWKDAAPGAEEPASIDALSNRELQVFRLIGLGGAPAAIAEKMGLSVKTVGSYRERIKSKLRLADGIDLDQAAYEFVRRSKEIIPPAR